MMMQQLAGLLAKPINRNRETAMAEAMRLAFIEKALEDGVLAINADAINRNGNNDN